VTVTVEQYIVHPSELIEEALFLEDEARELLCSNGDLQEVREKIESSKIKLQEAVDLLSSGNFINVNFEEDAHLAIWVLNRAIYFDDKAIRIIREDSLWRRRSAVAYLKIADCFKHAALRIIE